jgi:hypothetical protein
MSERKIMASGNGANSQSSSSDGSSRQEAKPPIGIPPTLRAFKQDAPPPIGTGPTLRAWLRAPERKPWILAVIGLAVIGLAIFGVQRRLRARGLQTC